VIEYLGGSGVLMLRLEPEEKALVSAEMLAAVVAAPDDDAPRLVYADWLAERGDPRGEFIQLGCELARTGAPELDRRVGALWRKHELTWIEPFRDAIQTHRWWRGFVEHVGADGNALATHGEPLLAHEPVTSIQLVRASRLARPLGDVRAIAKARTLDLSRNDLDGDGMARAFAVPLPNVRSLSLSTNPMGLVGLTTLGVAELPAIESLSLRSAGIDAFALDGIVDGPILDRLRELDLSNNPLGARGVVKLAQRALPRMEKLSLEKVELDETAALVLAAAKFPSLQRLELRFHSLPPSAWARLKDVYGARLVY
jgi:uncharacterized protein (TIGR02996 family)